MIPAHPWPAAPAWWLCPNDPPCSHGSALHDVDDLEGLSPICGAEGCQCGHPEASEDGS